MPCTEISGLRDQKRPAPVPELQPTASGGAIAPPGRYPGMTHFHVWTRAGRIFTMRPRVFESRHTATKAARRLRPDVADRLVLACLTCPKSRPSRRREPRWSMVARAVAQALGAPATQVRAVVKAAVAADRQQVP